MKKMMMQIAAKAKYCLTALSISFMYVMSGAVPVLADKKDSAPTEVASSGTAPNFDNAAKPVIELINALVGPIISIVGAIGAVYCIILGVKLAKADEPQEREKAKMALKNAIVGFFLIFILIVVMRLMLPTLTKWVDDNSTTTKVTPGK